MDNSQKEMHPLTACVVLLSFILFVLGILLAIYTHFSGEWVWFNGIIWGVKEFLISAYLFSIVFFLFIEGARTLALCLTMFGSFALLIITGLYGGMVVSEGITLGTTEFSALTTLLFISVWIANIAEANIKTNTFLDSFAFLMFLIFIFFLVGVSIVFYEFGWDLTWPILIFGFVIIGIIFGYIQKLRDERDAQEALKERINKDIEARQRREALELKKHAEYLDSPQGRRETLITNLTDISGVSDKIARTLLDQFPTFESIQGATEEDISNVPGIGKNLARAIKARINNLKNI